MAAIQIPQVKQRVRLIWHRRDLRLHDNPLYQNILDDECVASLFVFDDSSFRPRASCSVKSWLTTETGPFQARALIDAVKDLRCSLETLGSTLIVRVGDPAVVVPKMVQEVNASSLYFSEEPGYYESLLSELVKASLAELVEVHSDCSYTLNHPDTLPLGQNEWNRLAHPKQQKKKKRSSFAISEPRESLGKSKLVDVSARRFKGMSRIMGNFRRAVRESCEIAKPLPHPTELRSPHVVHNGDVPTLQLLYTSLLTRIDTQPLLGLDACLVQQVLISASSAHISGSESAGIRRLKYFMHHAATAKRDQADVLLDESSKFSTYLSLGSLSPRMIVQAATQRVDDCAWLVSHLEMRDYFIFSAFALGRNMFRLTGSPIPRKKKRTDIPVWFSPTQSNNEWMSWATGMTGLPLVDAAMIELRSTGYCSNRVRQNAVSLLTKDLKIDWRAGAELFQWFLADHCVAANWGNWMYFAGVGSDPKNRHFRTVSQALRYDSQYEYVSKWLADRYNSHLKDCTDEEALLRPWDFSPSWPKPIIDPTTQYTLQDLQNRGAD